jgi:hypothetical protein
MSDSDDFFDNYEGYASKRTKKSKHPFIKLNFMVDQDSRVFVVPHKVTRNTPLVKPLALAFNASSSLRKRIGFSHQKMTTTPDTPVKPKHKPKRHSAPINTHTPLNPLYQTTFHPPFTNIKSPAFLQNTTNSDFSFNMQTPTAPKRASFTFKDAPLQMNESSPIDTDMDMSPYYRKSEKIHQFHLESATPFHISGSQNNKKQRSPLGESPLQINKRQHLGDILMGSPIKNSSQTHFSDNHSDSVDLNGMYITENCETDLFRTASIDSGIENRQPKLGYQFQACIPSNPIDIKPQTSNRILSGSTDLKNFTSMIPVATKKNSLNIINKDSFIVSSKPKFGEKKPSLHSNTNSHYECSLAQHDLSLLSLSDLQPVPNTIKSSTSLKDTNVFDPEHHIPYYVLFSNQVKKILTKKVVFIDENFFNAADGKRESMTKITASLAMQNESSLMPCTYFDSNFTVITRLGGGEFGEVCKVRSIKDGCEYAIKRTKQPFSGVKDAYFIFNIRMHKIQEVKTLIICGPCQNIVSLISAWIQNGYLFIQMELCIGGK